MTRLYLVRHGQTAWNAQKRIQGQLDMALSPEGREQARHLACRLRDFNVHSLYSSDLCRARETAEIIADMVGLGLDGTFAALREIDFGRWAGRTLAEIGEAEPERLAWWREDAFQRRVPDGECFQDVMQRAVACINELLEKNRGRNILVVSHGGPLTHIIGEFLKLDMESRARLGLGNCSLTVLAPAEEPGSWQAEILNATDHLSGFARRSGSGVSW